MNNVDMYLKFRAEIDKICVPELLKCFETIPIAEAGEQIGLLCVARMEWWHYIDCLYLMPEYRRKGKGKRAVLNFYENNREKEIRLHIIHENKAAQQFWRSIFDLEEIESNDVDALYRIRGLRK